MSPDNFVEIIQRHIDSLSRDLERHILEPGDSRTSSLPAKRAEWLRSLSPEERAYVQTIIVKSLDGGLYWLATVLDGLQALDERSGKLELYYCSVDGSKILINDKDVEPLNEIFRDSKYQRP